MAGLAEQLLPAISEQVERGKKLEAERGHCTDTVLALIKVARNSGSVDLEPKPVVEVPGVTGLDSASGGLQPLLDMKPTIKEPRPIAGGKEPEVAPKVKVEIGLQIWRNRDELTFERKPGDLENSGDPIGASSRTTLAGMIHKILEELVPTDVVSALQLKLAAMNKLVQERVLDRISQGRLSYRWIPNGDGGGSWTLQSSSEVLESYLEVERAHGRLAWYEHGIKGKPGRLP